MGSIWAIGGHQKRVKKQQPTYIEFLEQGMEVA